VFFDPNSRPDGSGFSARIEKILRSTDVFLPGENELRLMFGGGPEDAIVESILALGVAEIWIKRGAKGSELVTRRGRIAFPPVRATTIDTTGAGDAYDGCVVWGHIRKLLIEKTGMYANAYAAMSTESIGAGESFPTQHQFMSSSQYSSAEGVERCVE
jgi:sugar/nucleoside kinase (ribokinase family)